MLERLFRQEQIRWEWWWWWWIYFSFWWRRLGYQEAREEGTAREKEGFEEGRDEEGQMIGEGVWTDQLLEGFGPWHLKNCPLIFFYFLLGIIVFIHVILQNCHICIGIFI